jgi:hypothetical protein
VSFLALKNRFGWACLGLIFLASPCASKGDSLFPAGFPERLRDEARRTYRVLSRGELLYLATTVGVLTVRMKKAEPPTYRGFLLLPDSVNDLTWFAGHLVIANGPSGLAIAKLVDPEHPKLVASLRLSGAAMAVRMMGTIAVVASGTAGVELFDLSRPAAPRKIDRIKTPGYARDLEVEGDRVYLADGSAGVRIYRWKKNKLSLSAAYQTAGEVYQVVPRTGKLFIAEGPAGLSIVDLENEKSPRLLGRIGVKDAAHGLALVQDLAVVADGTAGVMTIDVHRPSSMRELGRFPTDRPANKISLWSDRILLANDYDGLLVLELTAQGALRLVDTLPTRAQQK